MKILQTEFLDTLESFLNVYLPCSVGVSPNTVKSYKDTFRLLLNYLFAEKQISSDSVAFTDLNYDTMLGYLSWLETERKCSATTRNQRLSALSSFANYAQNRSFDAALVFRRDVNKIPSKKHQHKQRSVFTLEEVTILLNIPGNGREVELRDKTLLSVMYASGARAQEICDLSVSDIRFSSDTASLTLNGKGNKLRRVSIPKGCASLLKHYIDKRGIANNGKRHVFSSQTHEHMTVSCIEAIFKKYVRLAKDTQPDLFRVTGYSPHSMRHSTATHMLEAGVPLLVIKNFLGHSSFQSTQIYAAVTQSTLNRHVKEWNEKWGPIHDNIIVESDSKQDIPDFLKATRMQSL
jgi:site-specific recombinase XerD